MRGGGWGGASTSSSLSEPGKSYTSTQTCIHTHALMRAGMHSTHACTYGCIPVHTHTQHTDTKRLHTQMHTHTQTLVVLSTKITCTVFNEYIPLPPTPCFFLLPLFSLTYCLHRHSSPLSSGLFSLSSPPYHPTPFPPSIHSFLHTTSLLSHTHQVLGMHDSDGDLVMCSVVLHIQFHFCFSLRHHFPV